MDRDTRVMIADDQPGMRMALTAVLAKAEDVTLIGEAENGEQMIDLIEKDRPDLVFLDVEMPVMDGIECARRIQDIDPKIKIVFVTAHEQYMGDAFELYAFDYLVKPFKAQRVLDTLARVRTLAEPTDLGMKAPAPAAAPRTASRLMVKHKDGVTFLDMNEILLAQRENRSTVLITTSGEHTTSLSLSELEEKLDPKLFFRSHKSYIINIGCIDNITPYGRWTHVVRLRGTNKDALITHERFEELERMF